MWGRHYAAPLGEEIMKNMNFVLVIWTSLFLAGCASSEVRFARISQEVSAAGKKHDDAAIDRLASSIKAAELSQESMKKYSDEAVSALYDGLGKISFYLPDKENYTVMMERVFKEKVRRGEYTVDDVDDIFNAFVMSGLFNEAISLKQKFPGQSLPDVPEINAGDNLKSTEWVVYKVLEQGKRVDLQSLPKNGQRIIMVMRPGCEFAGMAADALFADPELGPIFRSNGLILTRKFEPADVAAIKKQFNFDAVYIARKSSDFPGFSLLRISPTFYFIKDAKILYEFSGWSNDDGGEYAKNKIRKGLTVIGIKTEVK